jgi:hypothetical protein
MKVRANKPNNHSWFQKINNYSCEKISFSSRLEAIMGIRGDGDAKSLRPYECDRCNSWHLTHQKVRTLFHTSRPKSNTIRPCDVFYNPPKTKQKQVKALFKKKIK